MNIVLFTNTFTPHVGGVARSVEAFTEEYRRRGHQVLVVAPEFHDTPEHEVDVVRIPAIQNFNTSDFSVALPIPLILSGRLDSFQPDLIHSQHPFLLGTTALRIARQRGLPLVFTHHTLYEQYTHYVPGDSPVLKRFVIELATQYANLCDQVFAPSESVRDVLVERGVTAPVLVVPTGVQPERFSRGNGSRFRRRNGIPDDAFVVGHLGRLAPEKNLEFLSRSVAAYLQSKPGAQFLVVGSGPSEASIQEIFNAAGVGDRLLLHGVLQHDQLGDALAAMDVFAFASMSETQGMVLTEAMAAGLPVVALDASGVREVVAEGSNGRLLMTPDETEFTAALAWVASLPEPERAALMRAARETADAWSMPRSADTALACYEHLLAMPAGHEHREESGWDHVLARIKAEWDIIRSLATAGEGALSEGATDGDKLD